MHHTAAMNSPFDPLIGRCQIADMLRLILILALLVPLAACGPLNTAAFTLSEEVEPPPADPDAAVRNWLWEQQRPLVPGQQLSRPATMPGNSALRASRWYVCLREPGLERVETVMIIRAGRVIETIPGPSPFFCDAQPYAPLRQG